MARSGVLFRVPFGMNTKLECRGGKLVFALPAMFAVFVVAGCSKAQPTSVLGDASHPAPVRFYTVAEETARRRIQAVGSLYALEESTLSSEVEGRVAEVLADVGDNVKQGQPLVRLDPEELQFEVQRQRGIVRQVRAQLGIGPADQPPGEYLRVQSPVMVLVRTDRLRARLAVPERWAAWVRDGVTIDLRVEAFPGETFHGRISRINPAVAQESRTFEAEALLVNLDARLKPGFFVQASIPSEKEEKTIFLPENAVNYRYGVYKVFLLNGNRVSERQIRPAGQTEDERGRRFEVAEGLKPGDRVAVAVAGELHDGAVVQEQPGGSPADVPAMK